MPIRIDFLANVSKLLRGTKDVEDAFEDVADSLDDMVQDGDKAERQLERNFREIADAAKDSGRDVGKGLDDGFDRARKGADDFKDEANSTAREAAASFDGSAESIGDAFQEVAANAFGGFGPLGAAAGIAAAAGIGLAVAGFESVDEASKESEQRAAEWADAYVEAGGRILSATQILEASRAIITDPEQFKQAAKNAKDWGVSESVAILAMAGDTNALAEAEAGLSDKKRERRETDIRAAAATAAGREALAELEGQIRDGRDSLDQLNGDMEAGAQRADIWSESLRLTAENTAGAKTKTDEFGDSITQLPDGTTIYIDAETGKATTDVEKIKNRIYSIPDDVYTRVHLDTAAADRAAAALRARLAAGVTVPVTTTDGRNRMAWQ